MQPRQGLTKQDCMEELSQACVRAIAACAGASVTRPNKDYGIDGSFNPIRQRGNRYLQSGYALHFQLKASTKWQTRGQAIVYDLEAKTYNDLIDLQREGASPCILILLALNEVDESCWLEIEETTIAINGSLYWIYLQGKPTLNKSTKTVLIPYEQRLDSNVLIELLERVKSGKSLVRTDDTKSP